MGIVYRDGAGESRLDIHQYYVNMLPMIAKRSTCIRRSVAAIITNKKNQILSSGYNGVPSGIKHCIDFPCDGAFDKKGDTTRCSSTHAETNCIIQCTNINDAYNIYCSCTPCFVCAKMILNTPIRLIIAVEEYPDEQAINILKQRNLPIIFYPYSEK
jgi:dCMP deaminase